MTPADSLRATLRTIAAVAADVPNAEGLDPLREVRRLREAFDHADAEHHGLRAHVADAHAWLDENTEVPDSMQGQPLSLVERMYRYAAVTSDLRLEMDDASAAFHSGGLVNPPAVHIDSDCRIIGGHERPAPPHAHPGRDVSTGVVVIGPAEWRRIERKP